MCALLPGPCHVNSTTSSTAVTDEATPATVPSLLGWIETLHSGTEIDLCLLQLILTGGTVIGMQM